MSYPTYPTKLVSQNNDNQIGSSIHRQLAAKDVLENLNDLTVYRTTKTLFSLRNRQQQLKGRTNQIKSNFNAECYAFSFTSKDR